MKALLSKKVLLIVVPVLVVGGLLAAAVLVLPRVMTVPIQIKIGAGAEQVAAAESDHAPKATSKPAKEKLEYPTLPFATRERVVNLSDRGGFRYLKVEIVLDVAIPHSKPGDKVPSGEAKKHAIKELDAEMAGVKPRIEDTINTVLAGKTAEELMTGEGRQRLRDELRAQLDRVSVENPIMGVYFTQFIIQ
jgi:flagellar basal body-associated protein FliL